MSTLTSEDKYRPLFPAFEKIRDEPDFPLGMLWHQQGFSSERLHVAICEKVFDRGVDPLLHASRFI